MTSTDFHVVRARAQDRHTVLELLAAYLPGTDIERRHEWLYERNPHGRAVTFLALDFSGAAVGLTSLFPRRVVVDRVVRLGSIGGDGYVLPSARRRGIATALHAACLTAMSAPERDDGSPPIEFMYGAPVPNNLKALERAGSRTITRLRRYVRPQPLHRALRSVGALGGRIRASLHELSMPDRRVAEVWERSSEGAAVLPVRDPAHYAWRFGASPAGAQRAYAVVEGGRTVALCALEHTTDRVALVDFLAPADRQAAALWATANATGDDELTTLVNDRAPSSAALWKVGFVPRETKDFQVLAPTGHPAAPTLFDPTRWYYTWGDGDLDRIF